MSNLKSKKHIKEYLISVNNNGIFDNDYDSHVPHTRVHDMVMEHMTKESDKKCKAIIIGWDGARADSMVNIVKSNNKDVTGINGDSMYSGIVTIKKKGSLLLAYTGGEADDKQTKQVTATAQGWASVLTGTWINKHKVRKFSGDMLAAETKTCLLKCAEAGKCVRFLAEWPEHFDNTYKREIKTAAKSRIDFKHLKFDNDEALHKALTDTIRNSKDTDLICAIYEAPDYNGHATGFSNTNYRYVKAINDLDKMCYQTIKEIQHRPTFDNEEWLIVVTSDHGGYKTKHGNQSIDAREVFIASCIIK